MGRTRPKLRAVLQPGLRKIAAVLVFLEVPAFAYFLFDDERSCIQTSCWIPPNAEWIITTLLVYGLPVVLGIALWRGSRVAAVLVAVGGLIVVAISAVFAVVFLLVAELGAYPFWAIPIHRLVVPGEVAAMAMILIGAAFLWGTSSSPKAMPSPSAPASP